MNDLWSRPARLELREPDGSDGGGEVEARLRFGWRLPRLVALLLQPRPPQESEPARDTDAPAPSSPPSPPPIPASSPTQAAPAVRHDPPADAPADPNTLAWRAIETGDLAGAEAVVRAWLEREPDSPWAPLLLVEIGNRGGRPEVVAAAFERLRTIHEEHPAEDAAEAYTQALAAVNRGVEADAIARTTMRRSTTRSNTRSPPTRARTPIRSARICACGRAGGSARSRCWSTIRCTVRSSNRRCGRPPPRPAPASSRPPGDSTNRRGRSRTTSSSSRTGTAPTAAAA